MKQQWLIEIEKHNRKIDKINEELREVKVVEKKNPIGEHLSNPKLDEMIYNPNISEFIRQLINRSKTEPLNVLLYGTAGTGKTYTAKMLSVELNKPFVYLNGQMTQKSIFEILTNLKEGALVCIDEIHNLSEKVSEIIYPAIEYNEISDNGKAIKLNNPMFVGTTTEPEMLPKPLRDRFIPVFFEEPDEEIIRKILEKEVTDKEVIDILLGHTTNIRVLKKLLKYMDLYGKRDMMSLTKVFRMLKINLYNGLSDEQSRYIEHLKKVSKASCREMSLVLQRSENFIKLEIEPELIKKGMISVTSRGRELSKDLNWDTDKELEKAMNSVAFNNQPKYTEDSRTRARRYLEEHKDIKDKFASEGMYLELVSFIAEQLENGVEPDLIDIYSFGTDKKIKETFEDEKRSLMDL